jgi:predicted RNA-binding Zn ribbon-like protein
MTENVRILETLELVGGTLCLDFTNTINSRLDPEHDYLTEYSDLIGWANKVGLLSPAQTNQLEKQAKQNNEEAEKTLERALELRELFYQLFSSALHDVEPAQKDLKRFVTAYGETFSRAQLIKEDRHYQTVWKLDEQFDAVLLPLIHSAGELLQSDDLTHVKECPGCGWLFLDTSKNQSRRWCSMNTCGVRDKMRRYHKKKRPK